MQLDQNIIAVANSLENVCITGEVGSGKREMARSIHAASKLLSGRFVTINCTGLSDSQFESELFGVINTEGLFSYKGAIEDAVHGTLYLNEISDLSFYSQAKLIHLIQSKSYQPLGSNRFRPARIRLITSTSHPLETASERGLLRPELLHLLTPLILHTVPLREKRHVIIDLLRELCVELGAQTLPITKDAITLLESHPFYGNVAELKNIAQKIVTFFPGQTITVELLTELFKGTASKGLIKPTPSKTAPINVTNEIDHQLKPNSAISAKSNQNALEQQEASYLMALLEENMFDKKIVAEIAGFSLRTLYRKLKKFELI